MPTSNIDDLFLYELQETHAAETLIATALAKTAVARRAGTEPLLGYTARTAQRLERLERIFELIGRQPDATRQPAMARMLAEIDALLGADSATETHVAAVLSVLHTLRPYLQARYVTLASWAARLGKPEVEVLLAATLAEEHAASAPASGPAPDRSDQGHGIGASMGDRLTALFDRKR